MVRSVGSRMRKTGESGLLPGDRQGVLKRVTAPMRAPFAWRVVRHVTGLPPPAACSAALAAAVTRAGEGAGGITLTSAAVPGVPVRVVEWQRGYDRFAA